MQLFLTNFPTAPVMNQVLFQAFQFSYSIQGAVRLVSNWLVSFYCCLAAGSKTVEFVWTIFKVRGRNRFPVVQQLLHILELLDILCLYDRMVLPSLAIVFQGHSFFWASDLGNTGFLLTVCVISKSLLSFSRLVCEERWAHWGHLTRLLLIVNGNVDHHSVSEDSAAETRARYGIL